MAKPKLQDLVRKHVLHAAMVSQKVMHKGTTRQLSGCSPSNKDVIRVCVHVCCFWKASEAAPAYLFQECFHGGCEHVQHEFALLDEQRLSVDGSGIQAEVLFRHSMQHPAKRKPLTSTVAAALVHAPASEQGQRAAEKKKELCQLKRPQRPRAVRKGSLTSKLAGMRQMPACTAAAQMRPCRSYEQTQTHKQLSGTANATLILQAPLHSEDDTHFSSTSGGMCRLVKSLSACRSMATTRAEGLATTSEYHRGLLAIMDSSPTVSPACHALICENIIAHAQE
eukprot:1161512-Pelagomonas_calceolata.AAC.30